MKILKDSVMSSIIGGNTVVAGDGGGFTMADMPGFPIANPGAGMPNIITMPSAARAALKGTDTALEHGGLKNANTLWG